MSNFENYYEYVLSQAQSFVSDYLDNVIEEIKDGNTDMYSLLNDDGKIHDWVDNDFIYVDLIDSAHILDQSDNVETDYGLWEGLEPMKAIVTQAFFTYRTDLEIEIREVLKRELEDLLEALQEQLDGLETELESEDDEDVEEEINEQIDELQNNIDNFEVAIGDLE